MTVYVLVCYSMVLGVFSDLRSAVRARDIQDEQKGFGVGAYAITEHEVTGDAND